MPHLQQTSNPSSRRGAQLFWWAIAFWPGKTFCKAYQTPSAWHESAAPSEIAGQCFAAVLCFVRTLIAILMSLPPNESSISCSWQGTPGLTSLATVAQTLAQPVPWPALEWPDPPEAADVPWEPLACPSCWPYPFRGLCGGMSVSVPQHPASSRIAVGLVIQQSWCFVKRVTSGLLPACYLCPFCYSNWKKERLEKCFSLISIRMHLLFLYEWK